MTRAYDEIVKDIKTVLEEKVAPSVAAHNGAIGFINFAMDTGAVSYTHLTLPTIYSV